MTFALTVPSAGNLESYIQSANQFRILTQEEELQLARSLRDEGSIEAARSVPFGIFQFGFSEGCF